ncbi:hypothetical protein C900_00348 [Fulvivirga imtechensis AK7]|uniref:Uncharacterized protein n=1 Tax=Fulvivirga imtechensis AK7 TaxID=1237149 RepID=L8JLV8_9BACT|nr:hypothetical protein C900_00348 [Fulvivirga imtechensis AK7]
MFILIFNRQESDLPAKIQNLFDRASGWWRVDRLLVLVASMLLVACELVDWSLVSKQ